MEYIKEHRPAYDEWMDPYDQVMGIRFDYRNDIEEKCIRDVFVDQSGNRLEVELPQRDRIGEDITVERYSEGYQIAGVTINQLEEYITEMSEDRIVMNFEVMIDENEWDP